VLAGELSLAAEILEGALEFVGERFKHVDSRARPSLLGQMNRQTDFSLRIVHKNSVW